MTDRPELTALLSESRWLGALAHKLCSDADRADDLVQETWLAALERPPRDCRPLRGWLATVLRSKLGDRLRGDARRAARERAVARTEELASTLDVVERAATHRDVVQAVLDLDEPYRTTVLLRYFEGLPPRGIALRMQARVATVDSRLVRGLAQLRAGLDRRFGRQAWLLAMLPIARDGAVNGSAATGVLIMNAALKVVTACVLIAAAVWWGVMRSSAVRTNEVLSMQHTAQVELEAHDEPSTLVDGVQGEPTRIGLASSAPTAPVETAPPAVETLRTVRGRILDVRGQGLSGLRLGIEGGSQLASSGPNGAFEIAAPPGSTAVVCVEPAWTTVLAGSTKILPTNATTVIVAPSIELAGRVVDEAGASIAGVEIALVPPDHLGADFGFALDFSHSRTWRTRTEPTGAFELSAVPGIDGAEVRISAGGFPTRVEPAPTSTNRTLFFVLARASEPRSTIAGRVVDPNGRSVAGARVGAGALVASADERGRFVLDIAESPRHVRIIAVAHGFLPVMQELDKESLDNWPDELVLRLGSAPLSITGRVVDRRGAAVEGARVWVSDATLLGTLDGDVATIESMLARDDHPFWAWVATDATGRFELPGLLERTYRVCAVEPRTLALAQSEPIAAGSTRVEILLSTDDVHEKLRGHVLTSDGTPVAGARVNAQRMALEVHVGEGTRDEYIHGEPVITDADGAFELARVPKDGVELFVGGDEIMFAGLPITRATAPDDVVVQVSLRMHVQVELDLPIDRADSVYIVDENGRRLVLRIMRAEASFTDMHASIADGRTEVLSVSDAAHTLVLSRGEAEVARRPLHLLPKTINVIRY